MYLYENKLTLNTSKQMKIKSPPTFLSIYFFGSKTKFTVFAQVYVLLQIDQPTNESDSENVIESQLFDC